MIAKKSLSFSQNNCTEKLQCLLLIIFPCAGNVLKEISEPAGAVIRVKDFMLGDPTISVLELWGAEYQESNALLVHAENRQTLQDICDREKVPVSFVGEITGKQW